jgi:hypothetical protein
MSFSFRAHALKSQFSIYATSTPFLVEENTSTLDLIRFGTQDFFFVHFFCWNQHNVEKKLILFSHTSFGDILTYMILQYGSMLVTPFLILQVESISF